MKRALIVVGGASRSGKSTLATRLGKLLTYDVFELDAIYRAISPVVADWTAAPDNVIHDIMRSSALSVIDAIARRDTSQIIEGGWIEPIDASTLADKYKNRTVIVVYLGFPTLDMHFALKQMKMHRSYRDWIWPKSKTVKERFFEEQIAGSRWYQAQCERFGLTFVDTSQQRDAIIQRTVDEIARMCSSASIIAMTKRG